MGPNDKATSLGLLFLRLGAGGFMAFAHGLGKVRNFLELTHTFPDPLHIGTLPSATLATGAEFFGALLVVVGLCTRPAALSVVITMLVAGLIHHAHDPWGQKEMAFLFAVAFSAIALAGPGSFSLDSRRKTR